ncbi:MAG: hypothetical protein P8Y72_17935 [Anaerolineales bacterium]
MLVGEAVCDGVLEAGATAGGLFVTKLAAFKFDGFLDGVTPAADWIAYR